MKMHFTRFLSIVVALIMLMNVMNGTVACATDSETVIYESIYDNGEDGVCITYNILKNGTARIVNSGVYADLYTYTIPEKIDGYVVSTIGSDSFDDGLVYDLREIIIPQSVTHIEKGAFRYCEILSHVGYRGSKTQWRNISIGENNDRLINARYLHFGFDYKKDKTITDNMIPPTCCDGGVEEICSCGHSLVIETIPRIYNWCVFTNYTYNNDATEQRDGTMTAYCDYGCGRTRSIKAVETAINPTIIDIYPGKTEKVKLMPENSVIFRVHATYSDGEGFWFSLKYPKELTPEFNGDYMANLPIRWSDYYDELEYGRLNGGMGDHLEGEELFSPHESIAGQTYYIEVMSQHNEAIEISLSMSGRCAPGHPSEAHTYKKTTTKATLSKNGKIQRECTVCGYISSKSTTIYRPTSFKLSTDSYTYNGEVKKPSVTVKDSKGNTLKKDTDYTVKYESGRKLPGKYTVTVTFKGKYSGTKKLAFTVAPRVTSKITATQTITTLTLKWNKVTGADGYRVYKYNSKTKKYEKFKDVTGTSLKLTKLKAGTTYKFKVRAYTKDDGTIFGKHSSAFATATKTKTPSITSLTSSTKGKAVIKWSNVSGETGYQVYYSTSKNGTYKKLASYDSNKTTGTNSKLTSKKTYYFKVRAYKKTASGTVYSSWSSVKSVKIK